MSEEKMVCEMCGKTLKEGKYVEKHLKKFCSKECYEKYESKEKNKTQEENSNVCEFC